MGDQKHRARTAADVEADIRKAMARHAAIDDRGFDTHADRQAIRNAIDDLLDEHALLTLWEQRCD